ncbi:MAG: H+/Na+-translocating ferredoxin:NAD+ oxidoreductase subunit, partial [Candidatus Atribacteria bacterium]|nr:H+/Na+-translocating ferredoxin:NAD+ oxidoreductase subunit [Candidatus Atribacteria bacterium]
MRVKTFPKGVHPPRTFKELTASSAIQAIKSPARVVLPLIQHTGAPLSPLVKKGERVKKGQKIADVEAFVSAPLHASVSGVVSAIVDWPHPTRGVFKAIVIERDGEEEERGKLLSVERIEDLEPDFLRKWIREGGMVGLGGAAFPTHVKVSPPQGKTIEYLILNGAECEPYLTCDHRVMLEQSEEILIGLRILARACGAKAAFIGIEENKPDCIQLFEEKVKQLTIPTTVVPLATKYPQGSEKHLILAILGREVPPGGLPLDVGVVVNNVQTAWALGRMALEGMPLVERVITVSGDCIKERGNFLVPIGTVLEELVEFCGGFIESPRKVVMGGPMMGIAQVSLAVPVIKGTSGFLFMKEFRFSKEYPCIRCGRCVSHCPMNLIPSQLAGLSEFGAFEEAERFRVMDCIECGVCAYVCPASIPITHRIKVAKAE